MVIIGSLFAKERTFLLFFGKIPMEQKSTHSHSFHRSMFFLPHCVYAGSSGKQTNKHLVLNKRSSMEEFYKYHHFPLVDEINSISN